MRAMSCHSAPTAGLYRRFVIAALVAMLTLGATYGAFNLAAVHLGVTWFPWFNHPLHGVFQLFGFVLLFTVGIAVQVLPRFLGAPLASPRCAVLSLPVLLAGLVVRGAALYFPTDRWAAWVLALGGVLLVAGVGLAYWSLRGTWRRPPGVPATARRPAFGLWVSFGTGWWLLSALFALASGVHAVVGAYGVYSGQPWNEAGYSAALMGGAVSWIFGMLTRIGPPFLGLTPVDETSSRRLWAGVQLSTALSVLGAVLRGPLGLPWADRVLMVGLVALGAVMVVFTLRLGVFRRAHPAAEEGLLFGVRVAFGFVWAFAALSALHLGLDLWKGSNHVVMDAARHALAQGFVGLIILVIATRLLVNFGGVPLAWPKLRELAVLAIAVGLGLRLFEVGAIWYPPLLMVSGTSGALAGAGTLVLGTALLVTVLRRPVLARR